MIGISDREWVAIRFETFANEVLGAAAYPRRASLDVEVFQTAERPRVDELGDATWTPASLGMAWGPVWSTAWFRIRGEVPAEMAGHDVALRFSSGTEALLWCEGEPRQGLGEDRERVLFFAKAKGGEEIDCLVEAACNLPLGVTLFWWDHPELHRRWKSETPGRLEACELVVVDEAIVRVREKLELVRRLALALPEESSRTLDLIRGLRGIVNRIPTDDPASVFEDVEPELDDLLAGSGALPATTCFPVGHAHIDTAWLWRIVETRRKVLRSWTSSLELMERFDDYRFLASQAQQYAFVEEDSPALFEQIRTRVAEGRWEAAGAMWVESDCWAPSGESLVRQILHGVRYWRERFGDDAPQRLLWLPDTFGFPACLPQIMRRAGLDTFVTNKLWWSERNEFPHVTFRWRGIDGTEILSHLTPGRDYNSPLQPDELVGGEAKLTRLDKTIVGTDTAFVRHWLQPYGYGDGGGGPTAEMARRAETARGVEGLPEIASGGVSAFCEALHEERRFLVEETGRDVAVWDGELYIEQHQGTLTSQAWLKRANTRAERRLRVIEAMLALGTGDERASLAPRLDRVWKDVLLHQFHDLLPGSSIHEVYDDAREAYVAIDRELDELTTTAAAPLIASGESDGMAEPTFVFNPSSHAHAAYVEVGEGIVAVPELPPLGWTIVDAAASTDREIESVRVTERTLENEHLALTLDDAGRIAELRLVDGDRRVNAEREPGVLEPLNQLVVYEDRPRRWEAWNVDHDYEDRAFPLDDPAEIEVIGFDPRRAVIEVRRRFRASAIVQRYSLDAGARRVEIDTRVDWREPRMLLRCLHPVAVRARFATCGIQFGHLLRPTHRNTAWEDAQHEVAGHRWLDLSQPGLGLALLDDGRFGRSCRDGVLALSLLRSPTFPDPSSDLAEHVFRYALLPHQGDWRAAGVPREADEVADRPLVLPASVGATCGDAPPAPFRLTVEPGGDIEIAAFKPVEQGDGLILRLVERHGGLAQARIDWDLPVSDVWAVDLLEQESEGCVEHDLDRVSTTLTLAPFEIVTLRATLASAEPPSA